jgi:hypothetical protein
LTADCAPLGRGDIVTDSVILSFEVPRSGVVVRVLGSVQVRRSGFIIRSAAHRGGYRQTQLDPNPNVESGSPNDKARFLS